MNGKMQETYPPLSPNEHSEAQQTFKRRSTTCVVMNILHNRTKNAMNYSALTILIMAAEFDAWEPRRLAGVISRPSHSEIAGETPALPGNVRALRVIMSIADSASIAIDRLGPPVNLKKRQHKPQN